MNQQLKSISFQEISPDPDQPRRLPALSELQSLVNAGDPAALAIWEALLPLASSILQGGMEHPIIVFPSGNGYSIYDGERRWLSVQLLYQSGDHDGYIQCYVRERPNESEAVLLGQLNVNSQREGYNAFELARGLQRIFAHLREHGGSTRFLRQDGSVGSVTVAPGATDSDIWEVIEKQVGIGRSRRYQIMAVLENLSKPIQQLAEDNGLRESKLRYVIPLRNEQVQEKVIREVLAHPYSNAVVKAKIAEIQKGHDRPAAMPKPIQIETALSPIRGLARRLGEVKNIPAAIAGKDPRTVERYRAILPDLRTAITDIQRLISSLEYLET